MGVIKKPPAAKLFVAMIIGADGVDKLAEFDKSLEEKFGSIDIVSRLFPFECTDYYKDEMGERLKRRFVFFEKLIDPGDIADVKIVTNELELEFMRKFRGGGKVRIVNLDAGYLTLGQVVLATTKSYSHRIYLRDGIWAEVTLYYYKGKYTPWPWTYPDYRSGLYDEVFIRARNKLKGKGRGEG